MNEPVQVDPVGCGCTECLTGLYVPLDRATDEQVRLMAQGVLSNATSEQFTMTMTVENYLGEPGERQPVSYRLTAQYSGRSWEWRAEDYG